MATFENYQEEKWWWFYAYIKLAAAICAHPSLSAKNSDFLTNFEAAEIEKLQRTERVFKWEEW